jgi:S1-C subfamily serine protease
MNKRRIAFNMIIPLVLLIGFFLGTGVGTTLYAQEAGGHGNASAKQGSFNPGMGTQVGPGGTLDKSFVTQVFEDAGPAVVYVTTQVQGFDFFMGGQTIREGMGSGFIVDAQGLILTNYHVIQGANSITVVLADGKELTATVVGSDISTDLAVLRVTPGAEKLPVIKLGDSSKLRVGDWVIAIGNPYGFNKTVTFGVVSSNERTILAADQRTISNVIQTDAAINPGNSGGPLLNALGEVVGINSAILSQSGGSEGIGLAIPINVAKSIMDDLLKYGRVLRPWLGVEVVALYPRFAARYNLPLQEGLLVREVYKDSPAAKAGILPPMEKPDHTVILDVITKADGKDVKTYTDLIDAVRAKKVDGKIDLVVVHIEGGARTDKKLTVQLAPLPETAPITGAI